MLDILQSKPYSKDIQGSAPVSALTGAVIWTWTVYPGMRAVLTNLANYTDIVGAYNGTTFWSLQRNGIGLSPYDLMKDQVGVQTLPPPSEPLIFNGGDVISFYGYNGYASSIKMGLRILVELYGM